MKRFIYLTVAALAFAACAKEITPDNVVTPDNNPVAMVDVQFTASIAQEGLTKAEIDMSTGTGSWEAGDSIAVHTQNGELAILKTETAGTSVTFSGKIKEGDAIPADAVAYYPALIAVEGDATKVNLPSSYSSAAEAAKGFLLRGVLSGETITFKHIGALLKVSVNDVPASVTSVVLSTGVAITGQLDVDATDADAPIAQVGTGATSVEIASAAADRESPAVFLIPLPAGTLSGGFTITLKEGSSAVSEKTTDSNVTIGRAKLVKMKAFTPEPLGSNWYVAGGFNSWNTTANQMHTVYGHPEWLVAENVNTAPASGQDAGFKFVYNTTWKGIASSADVTLHTQYEWTETGASNITIADGTYDIYLNPGADRFFVANAGEPWVYKTIYLMSDMVLSDLDYYLHIWPHSGSGLNTTWPGIACSGTEIIAGLKYYKFPVAICDGDFTSNTYDCIFSDGATDEEETQKHVIRYDFRDGGLAANSSDDAYYACFSGSSYNKGERNYTYGDGKTNPMTQFTNPSEPQGNSNWYLLKYNDKNSWSSASTNLSYNRMVWNNGPVLVYKDILLDSSNGLTFRYTNGHSNTFYYYSGTESVSTDAYFDLTFDVNKDRSSVPMITNSLDGKYICDVYLDILNGKAKIVPIAKIGETTVSLYFLLTDRVPTQAKLYAWQGSGDPTWKNADWPGENMTYVKEGNIEYYKADILAENIWGSSTKLIVDDYANSTVVWQTSDYTGADWSGRKDAYYFTVSGNTITQLSEKPAAISVTIGTDFSDWANSSIPSKDYSGSLATLKAFSDGSRLFIYQKYDGSVIALTEWDNYTNLYFDVDNSNSTGKSEWFATGLDSDLQFRYYQSGAVRTSFVKIYFKTYGSSGWSDTSFEDSNVDWYASKDDDNNIEVEMSIPISQINVTKNSIIRIGFVAATPQSTNSSEAKMLTVRIPNVS